MKILIFDIEADAQEVRDTTKIHCISWRWLTENREYLSECKGDYTDLVTIMSNADHIVGHNIILYDLPVIKKLTGWVPSDQQKVSDTYLMGCIGWPDETQSLEDWGLRIGSTAPKIPIDDFSVYSPELGRRCTNDVKINEDVYMWMLQSFDDWEALLLEQQVAEIHARQVEHGVYVDMPHAIKTVERFDRILEALERKIKKYAPKKTHGGKYKSIEEPHLKGADEDHNGNKDPKDLKKAVKDWFPQSYWPKVQGGFSRLIIEELNLNSHPQVKELLLDLGWKPTEWNFKRDEYGQFERTSPKLTEDSFASLPSGLGKDISDYYVLKHRRNFISNVKDPQNKGIIAACLKRGDDRVSATAFTCGTPTSRYKHSGVVCNPPGAYAKFGPPVRECFSTPSGHLMLGTDLEGIEARMLAHFCLKYTRGEDLRDIILHGDFHQSNADIWGVDRNTAKRILYALMYGAGPAKLASIAEYPQNKGQELKDLFYKNNPSISELVKDLEDSLQYNGNHIIGLTGRKVYIREKRKLLNSLLQQGAAEVFKRWMIHTNYIIQKEQLPMRQIIAYHDELEFEVYSDDLQVATTLGEYVCKSAEEVGTFMNLDVPIEAALKVGKNWMEVH